MLLELADGRCPDVIGGTATEDDRFHQEKYEDCNFWWEDVVESSFGLIVFEIWVDFSGEDGIEVAGLIFEVVQIVRCAGVKRFFLDHGQRADLLSAPGGDGEAEVVAFHFRLDNRRVPQYNYESIRSASAGEGRGEQRGRFVWCLPWATAEVERIVIFFRFLVLIFLCVWPYSRLRYIFRIKSRGDWLLFWSKACLW